jgi:hypothetical protein
LIVAVAFLALSAAAQAAAPTLTLPANNYAVAGSTGVVLTGTNFIATPANNTVKFNGVAATVTAATLTSLTVTVPAGGTSGTVTSSNDFFVVPSTYTTGQVDQMTRLTLGTPVATTIASNHIAIQVFDTTSANQRIFIKWTGSTIPQMTMKLSDPNGGFVVAAAAGVGTNWIDTFTLPTIGTYTLTISPDSGSAGVLTMNVSSPNADFAATVTPTGAGVATAVTTTTPGQNGKITFSGTAGRRVFLSLTGSTITAGVAALLDPSGGIIATAAIQKNATWIDATALPSTSANYSISIDPSGPNVGAVTATLYDLAPTDGAPVPIASLPGGAVITTTTPGVNAQITFPAVVGHRFSVKMTSSSFTTVGVSVWKPDTSQLGTTMNMRGTTSFLDSVAVPTSGTYTLKIDPIGAATGSATFTVYDISADAIVAATLPATAPASAIGSITIATPGQNGYVTFSGTTGERVAVEVNGTTISGGKVSLLGPNGVSVGDVGLGATSFLDTGVLNATGVWQVRFDPSDSATGSISFTIWNVPADIGGTTPVSITPSASLGGGTANATVATPGQNAFFSFTATAGQKVAFKVGGTLIKAGTLTLRDAGLTTIGSNVTFGTSGGWGEGFTIPTTGTYTIKGDPTGKATGNIIIAAFLVPADASAAIVSGGASVTIANTVPGQNMRLTFTGTAGRAAMVKLSASPVTAGTIQLLDPSNAVLGTGSIAATGALIDAKTLPSTGTYTVLIDPKTSVVGSATAAVFDVQADATGTLVSGTPLGTNVVSPGQNVVLTIPSITAGQRLAVAISSPGYPGTMKLLNPDGTTLATKTFSASGAFIDATTTTQNGNYSLKVDPTGVGVGSAIVTFWNVPANVNGGTIVKDGVPVVVTTTTPGQNATLSFTANAQDSIKLAFSNVTIGASTCCSTKITITTPTGTNLTLPKSIGTGTNTPITSILPTTGTYTITIDPQANATGGARFALLTN